MTLQHVMLIWIMTVLLTGALTTKPCPQYCVCKKSQHSMACDGKGGVLTSIPKPPSYVRMFKLSHANLGRMTKDIVKNLIFCKLTHIQLEMNNITNISPDALSELKYLQKVEWKQDYLPIAELGLALQHLQSRLISIIIQAFNVDTEIVHASSFQHLISLRTLGLNLKEMKMFNTTGLRFLRNLTHLYLDDNQLADFSLKEEVPKLETLLLTKNDLINLPTFCFGNERGLTPELSYLNVENNAIRILDTSGMSCLKYLQKLTLSQNRIEHLNDNAFANLPALFTLQLSRMTSLLSIGNLAFNSSSLAKLSLIQNPKLSVKRFKPKILFTHTPYLSHLDLTNTKLGLETEELKNFLLTLKNIQQLTLQKTSIKGLPVGVFSRLRKLTKLVLSGNYFYGWDEKVFVNVTSIRHIFLDGNNIKTINESSFPVEFRRSIQEINLSNNPFDCTCNLLWFRNWMKEVIAKRVNFTNYPHRYYCISPRSAPHNLSEYNPTLESCTISQLYFVILVIALSLCILFTVAGLVTYRYRWYVLYWISLMRRRRQRQGPPSEIHYDGFVSYSNPDSDWVSSEVMDFLEGHVGMRLCEHSRDFKAGMYIVDNVIEAMDTSRKTILVISNEYMKSDWCQFELQMALSSFLNHEIDIVVILLQHIRSANVTSSLRALMVSTTYIEWSDDAEAKRLFQEQLKNALRET